MNIKESIELDKKYIFGTYRRTPLLIEKSDGKYVIDSNGDKYLDLVTGLAVNSLGYNNKQIISEIIKQLSKVSHTSNLYYTEPQITLAKMLCRLSKMEKVFFCNSGAEANEAALKLVRKYSIAKYGREKFEILCMKNSFHGRTFATITATGQEQYRKGFGPLLSGFKHAEFNNLTSVEKLLSKRTAAIMLEPVQGEAGIYVADKDFIKGLDSLRKEKDILLIFDEVQCGLGRTGKLFAFQHFGVKPDVLTLAKPLGGGLPIGAMLSSNELAAAFSPGAHASTFGANPVVCAAAAEFLKIISDKNFLLKVTKVSKLLLKNLQTLKKESPDIISEIRGLGLMIAIEIKTDARKIAEKMMKEKIIVNPIRDNIIRILPPLIIDERDIDIFITAFKKCIKPN